MTITDALAAAARPPSAGERRQLATMQAQVALDALRAGDLRAGHVFLTDALLHLRAALGAEPERHGLRVVAGSLDHLTGGGRG